MNNLIDTPQDAHLIEVSRQDWVDKRHALERLYDNPDFQTLILQGYFQDRAINGVSMLANYGVVRSGARPELMEEMVAISRLQDYFITVRSLGAVISEDEDESDLDE